MRYLSIFFITLLIKLSQVIEARYVTKASRDLMRHVKRQMEHTYGLGLTGLVHPVTKEFNHKAVIHQRGGRFDHEVIGDTKPIHNILGALHGLVQAEAAKNWTSIAG